MVTRVRHAELLDKIHQLRGQTDFNIDDVLADIDKRTSKANRKPLQDAAITMLAINEYFHSPRKAVIMPDVTRTRTLDIVTMLSSCMEMLIRNPSTLTRIVMDVGSSKPDVLCEIAYGVFPALFGHFTIRSLRRSAMIFLEHLRTCNLDNWSLVVPFISAFTFGTFQFHEIFWTSLRHNLDENVLDRLEYALSLACTALAEHSDLFTDMPESYAIPFVFDIITSSLQCSTEWLPVLDAVRRIEFGSPESYRLWNTFKSRSAQTWSAVTAVDGYCIDVFRELNLSFKGNTLVSFVNMIKQSNDTSLKDSDLFKTICAKTQACTGSTALYHIYIRNTKDSGVPGSPVKCSNPEYPSIWKKCKEIAKAKCVDVLTMLGSDDEFVDYALNEEICELETKRAQIEKVVEMKMLSDMIPVKTEIMVKLAVNAKIAFCGLLYRDTFKNKFISFHKKVENGLQRLSADGLVVNDFVFPIVCVIMDNERQKVPTVLKRFAAEKWDSRRSDDFNVPAEQITYLKMRIGQIQVVPMGQQMCLMADIVDEVQQVVSVMNSLGNNVSECGLFKEILPCDVNELKNFLRAAILVSECSAKLDKMQIQMQQVTKKLNLLYSWIMNIFAHNQKLIMAFQFDE